MRDVPSIKSQPDSERSSDPLRAGQQDRDRQIGQTPSSMGHGRRSDAQEVSKAPASMEQSPSTSSSALGERPSTRRKWKDKRQSAPVSGPDLLATLRQREADEARAIQKKPLEAPSPETVQRLRAAQAAAENRIDTSEIDKDVAAFARRVGQHKLADVLDPFWKPGR